MAGGRDRDLGASDPYRASQPGQPPSVYLSMQPHGRPGSAPTLGGSSIGPATLEAAFDKFDKEGRGYLSMKDVAAALRSLGLAVTPKTLAHFADADTDGDGALRLEEFRSLVMQIDGKPAPGGGGGGGVAGTGGPSGAGGSAGGSASLSAAELMEAKVVFSKHDVNKDATTREPVAALKDLHLPTDTSQAVSTLHEFDKDSDGSSTCRSLRCCCVSCAHSRASTPPPPPPHCARPSAPTTRGVGSISVADVRPA